MKRSNSVNRWTRMSETPKKPPGMTRRFALTLPAAFAVAVRPSEAKAFAISDTATAPPVAPTRPAAPFVGPDGLTDWQRDKLAYFERIYDGRDPAIKPMASVKGMSPKFQRMAVDLDVALGDYHHLISYKDRILRGVRHHGIPETLPDDGSYLKSQPFLARIYEDEEAGLHRCSRLIEKIELAKAVTRGDRTLRRNVKYLRGCNGFFQHEAFDDSWAMSKRSGSHSV